MFYYKHDRNERGTVTVLSSEIAICGTDVTFKTLENEVESVIPASIFTFA